MAKDENESLGAFGKLFNKNVPHILESIFLSLDYDSFMTCHNVCFAWKYLFMSDSFKEGAEKLLAEKMRREEMIYDSVRSGDIEEVDRLLSSGVDPNCKTFRTRIVGKYPTPLYQAAYLGHKDIVRSLIGAGADPNIPDEIHMNCTPLQLVAARGYTQLVKLLLDAGADPHHTDKHKDILINTMTY